MSRHNLQFRFHYRPSATLPLLPLSPSLLLLYARSLSEHREPTANFLLSARPETRGKLSVARFSAEERDGRLELGKARQTEKACDVTVGNSNYRRVT